MSDQEKRIITPDSFKEGDVLVNRTNSSRTARVIQAVKRDNKFTGFLVMFNTGKQGKLSKFDLEKDSCPWVLRGMSLDTEPGKFDTEATRADFENFAKEYNTTFEAHDKLTTADGVQAEVQTATPEAVEVKVTVGDETVDAIMTPKEAAAFPLMTTADLIVTIQQLRAELKAANDLIVIQDNQIEGLKEVAQSAIDHDAAGSDIRAESHEEPEIIEMTFADDIKAHAVWLKVGNATRLFTTTEVEEHLTEQLAEARASNAALRSQPVAVAPAGVALKRCHQVETFIQWLPEYKPEKLAILNKELAEKLDEGWEIMDFTVTTATVRDPDIGDDTTQHHRIITFIRNIDVPPTAPEPLRGAVQAVPGTHFVIPPVGEDEQPRTYQEAHAEALQFANQHMSALANQHRQVFASIPSGRPSGLKPALIAGAR